LELQAIKNDSTDPTFLTVQMLMASNYARRF